MVDEELSQPEGAVFFFCVRGKHRSAAAVASYMARCTGNSAEDVMSKVTKMTSEQRGARTAAKFHDQHHAFPPLAPLVRATVLFSSAPLLPS